VIEWLLELAVDSVELVEFVDVVEPLETVLKVVVEEEVPDPTTMTVPVMKVCMLQ
jgi:hypothetical protein